MAGLRDEAERRQAHDQWWGPGEAGHAAPGGSADCASGYVDDSRSAGAQSARLVGYFSSVTAANRQPTSFRSNRIANRRRSTRGAPPRAGTYSNIARTLPLAVGPPTRKSSIVNFAVI